MTIREIAAAAGVSRGTVDRVVNNRGKVRPEIAERVRRCMDELGYTPNKAGKALVARKNPIKIGCFLPSLGNPFFDEVIRGFRAAEAELRDFGLGLLLREARGYQAEEHIAALRGLVEEGASAICAATLDVPAMRGCVNAIAAGGVPVIALNNELPGTKRLCYVGGDFQRGGRTAAKLLTLLCREPPELLIVTGSLQVKGHNDRVTGLLDSLKELGVSYNLAALRESLDDDDLAYDVTLRALGERPEINCVYIAAGGVEGVCRAIRDSKARALKVISFDDPEGTRALLRSGEIDCTICQEPFRQGYQAVSGMFHYLLGGKKTAPPDCLTETVIKVKENI